jgi:hypothetical protein
MVEELLGFTLKLAIPTEFPRSAIKETKIASLIYFFKEGTVISEAAMKAETPEAVGPSICLIGFFSVSTVVSFNRVNNANANFSN